MTGADTAPVNITNTENSACNPLDQFVLLAKSAKGAAALELVKQVIETPGVHVFGELLDMPNIKELETGAHAEYWNTLNLFAYGTYKQYLQNKTQMLDLTSAQKKKLRHLTIVTLASKSKCIPYSILLEELDIKNVRDLEDLIIEAVYADIIHGKLDQKNSQLEVEYAGLGRDVRPADIGAVARTLANWGQACSTMLECIEQQVAQANNDKLLATQHKDKLQIDIANIKKSLLAQSATGGVQEADLIAGGSREDMPGHQMQKRKQVKLNKGSEQVESFGKRKRMFF